MIDYGKCLLFFFLFTAMLYALGCATVKKEQDISYKFVAGYLIYSFFAFVGGIVVQALNLPWMYFAIYLGVVWAAALFFTVCRYQKREEKELIFQISVGKFIRENWILLLVLFILTGMLFFYYRSYWYGNRLDDGYYITKVATLPLNETRFRTNYSVGILDDKIDIYTMNTWELEASVYVRLLGVRATLFLRLFQSAFHYFLLLNCAVALSRKIFAAVNGKWNKKDAQYPVMIVLLFGMFYLFLEDTNFFLVGDAWQTNTAMFFGSSVVRVTGILLLLLPYLDMQEVTVGRVLGVGAIAAVLMSKSTIALPLIIVVPISYLAVWIWLHKRSRGSTRGLVLLAALWTLLGIVLPNGVKQQEVAYELLIKAVTSPVFLACSLVFFLSFRFHNTLVKQLNYTFLILFAVIAIPQVNDVFEQLSVYGHVVARAWAAIEYTYIILNSVYLFLLACEWFPKIRYVKGMYGVIGFGAFVLILYSFDTYGGELFLYEDRPPLEANVKHSIKVIYENPDFAPKSAIELGESLERLSERQGEKLYVVMPELVGLDDFVYALAVQVRAFAPDIVSVSAINRYPAPEGSRLYGYHQAIFDAFANTPDSESSKRFEKEAEKYGINCIVVQNEDCKEYLREMGYTYYESVKDDLYQIWYR